MNDIFNKKDIIYTIYQEKSFSKAAQKLFIAQTLSDLTGFPFRQANDLIDTTQNIDCFAACVPTLATPGLPRSPRKHWQNISP